MKYALFVLMFFSLGAFGQDDPTAPLPDTSDVISGEALIDAGIIRLSRYSAAPATQITAEQFNSGNIHDPLQLIQGKVSGLFIAKPGNDPNEPFKARLRGVNSVYMSNGPLIVVDGMPFSTMLNVDPIDISKITVIKDAATASQFGLNSLSGVILIETHTGENRKLRVRHYSAFEVPEDQSDLVLSSSEYVAMGGADLGSSTDWQKEITRNTLSTATSVSYGDKKGGTEYYTAFNYRNASGILENSGFENYNGRSRVSQKFFNERLTLGAQFSIAYRNNSFSFREAFRHAKTFIPTAPIYFPSGDYSNLLLFENHHPVAMIRQNIHDGATTVSRLGANVDYRINNAFVLKAGFQREDQENEVRKYWSSESLWFGTPRGRREQQSHSLQTNFGFVAGHFSKRANKTLVDIHASVSAQNLDFQERSVTAFNFPSDEVGRRVNTDFSDYDSVGSNTYNYRKNHGIKSYRLAFSTNTNDNFFISANLSKESFSDHMQGFTYGLAVALEFADKDQGGLFSTFKPKLSIGRAMGGMSLNQNYNPGNIIQSWRLQETEEKVKPERKTELTAGIDWSMKNISGSVNFFKATTKRVATIEQIDADGDGIHAWTAFNRAQVRNSGIEVDVSWSVINKADLQLRTSLNFSTVRNVFEYDREITFYPEEFVLGVGGAHPLTLHNNRPIGQVRGLHFQGVVNNQFVYWDKDGDGQYYYPDFVPFGRPLPGAFLGWTTEVKSGKWSANVVFRGAFGHQLYNLHRYAFENPLLIRSYNMVSTIDRVKDVDVFSYSSDFYLEDASYFTMDNLGITYDIYARAGGLSCTINLGVQNLFRVTSYTGATPEARVENYGISTTAGLDSQYTYSPSRTFVLGIQLSL